MKTFVLTAVTALFALGCAHKKANTHTSYQKQNKWLKIKTNTMR